MERTWYHQYSDCTINSQMSNGCWKQKYCTIVNIWRGYDLTGTSDAQLCVFQIAYFWFFISKSTLSELYMTFNCIKQCKEKLCKQPISNQKIIKLSRTIITTMIPDKLHLYPSQSYLIHIWPVHTRDIQTLVSYTSDSKQQLTPCPGIQYMNLHAGLSCVT